MNKRIRTVTVNERGQIVIRKESDVLGRIEEEDRFWRVLADKSTRRAWGKEDEAWDKILQLVKRQK